MKQVTIDRDQFITASGVTDEGTVAFVQKMYPETVVINVEDVDVIDVTETVSEPTQDAEEVDPEEEDTSTESDDTEEPEEVDGDDNGAQGE